MSRLPLDLPLDREKAMELVAKGWTRTPTHAHPHCNCIAQAKLENQHNEMRDVFFPHWPWSQRRSGFIRKQCPIHPKAR